MRNKLKKRFTRKVKAAFKASFYWPGCRRSYHTGLNSTTVLSKKEARSLAKYVESQSGQKTKARDLMNSVPVSFTFPTEDY